MRVCLTCLHQVHGTLIMLELQGVTLLADHLERLAQELLDNNPDNETAAVQSLMQGILELPGYVDEIQRGAMDSCEPMLPLINEIRDYLNEEPIESTQTVIDITASASTSALERFDSIDGIDKARKIRSAYQQVLLSIIKGENLQLALDTLAKVAQSLSRVCANTPHETQWQAFGEFVASLNGQQGRLEGDVIRLLRRMDSEIRALATEGTAALKNDVSVELVQQLLDTAELHDYSSEVLTELRAAISSESHSSGLTISGRQALASAADVLREELSGVKDQLDLYTRASEKSLSELSALTAPLKQIGSTLSLLGFESSKIIVADQLETLSAVTNFEQVDEPMLLSIASALVQVDENLASFSTGGNRPELEVIAGEAQKTVVTEARAGLDQAKQAIVDYISSQWDVQHLAPIPELFRVICGALDIIVLPRAARLLSGCSSYIETTLVNDHVPQWEDLDHLADAISGVDYYLERLNDESSGGTEDILALVEHSLGQLGYGALIHGETTGEGSLQDEPTALLAETEQIPAEAEAIGEDAEDVREDAEDVGLEAEDVADAEDVREDAENVGEDAEDVADAEDVDENTDDVREETEADVTAEPLAATEEDQSNETVAESNEPTLQLDDEGFDLGNELFDLVEETAEAETSAAEDVGEDAVDVGAYAVDVGAYAVEVGLEAEDVREDAEDVREDAEDVVSAEDVIAAQAVELDGGVESIPASTAHKSMSDSFESDEEIVEIFVEEANEILETIDTWEPRLRQDLQHPEALAELRRAFHTLKGSGRIVGANVLGELAWSVENMLNRLIDETVEPTGQFVDVVVQARQLIPQLRDNFEMRTGSQMVDVVQVMEQADLLASGSVLEPSASMEEPSASMEEPSVQAANQAQIEDDEEQPLALFLGEAENHLEVLMHASEREEIVLNEEVLRALHTLSGSAAMAGIDSVAELAGPTYKLVQAVQSIGSDDKIGGETAEFLHLAISALSETVSRLRADQETGSHARLVAQADRLLAGVDQSASPRGIMELECIPVILEAPDFIESWCAGPLDTGFAEEFKNALNEVIGAASAVQCVEVESLAAVLRDAYTSFENGAIDESCVVVLGHGHERLLQLFDSLAADQTLGSVEDVVAELVELVELEPLNRDVEEIEDVGGDAEDVANAEDVGEKDAELGSENLIDDNVVDFSVESIAEYVREDAEDVREDAEDVADAEDVREDAEDVAVAEDAGEDAEDAGEDAEDAGEDAEDVSADVEQIEPVSEVAEVLQGISDAELIPEDIDTEIIDIFFEEADEIMEKVDHNVQEWAEEPTNLIYVENLLRDLHTLKGGARLAGMIALGDETHHFESFLVEIQRDQVEVDAEFFTELHVRHDRLAALVVRFQKVLQQAGEPEAPQVVQEQGVDQQAEAAAVEAAPEQPEAERVSAKPPEAEPKKKPEDKTSHEMVRVGSKLLESLVNLAGESSIVRARIEQGINDFSGALDEMEITIERVREQLRRLEIETETQILFRRENVEGPAYENFDPLEMDRYSQLQQLSRGLSESASDMLELKDTLLFKARDSETLLLQQARINTELQEGLMRTHMVPFSRMLPKLRRIVRQVSRELNKEVDFHAYNTEGELDRNLLERMVAPLEHMLRNAVDHGIESPELRKSFGKPATGRIDLRLSREGGDVVIEISDDGAGIDVESVREKAVERGLMTEGATLNDEEVSQFVLAPGFSTAKSVTQISGRGVGMDVVHSEVKQLGGSINIISRAGRGTRFVVRVPFTVSINRALMVSIADDLYAIPLNTIEGIVLLAPEEIERLYAPDGNTFEYAGIPYSVRYLGQFLGREYNAAAQRQSVPVVLVRSGDHSVAVHVDSVQGSREIVVKSLGPQFAGVGGISGATILGDGSVVVILDLLALIRARSGEGLGAKRRLASETRARCVMVVDDSVTVRKVTSRLLERQGIDVIIAKDGVEAIAMLQERKPDIMLLDIEMPRMDGFEVARQVRHDERLSDLPIIMISSRTGTKHKEHARELGVDGFLGKPFQESELLAKIDELVN
ncbi:MAG: Hpt domain-containing protein [Gammaproteobacteria bacterium]|nr:Hpt domain-containing protein [Gammaproteobacteria bacterium]